MSKVLVLAVHPDDETLGCGGTLLRHKAEGDEIFWLVVTAMRDDEGYKEDQIAKRAAEIESVGKRFGFTETVQLAYPAGKLDQAGLSNLVVDFSKVFKDIEPEVLYLPFKGDVHSDHRVSFAAAYSCTKTFRYPFIKRVYMMETISETDFAPATPENTFLANTFVDISPYIDTKIEIMNTYASEITEHPFPRSEKSIRALATLRGAQSGYQAAESFMLLKERR